MGRTVVLRWSARACIPTLTSSFDACRPPQVVLLPKADAGRLRLPDSAIASLQLPYGQSDHVSLPDYRPLVPGPDQQQSVSAGDAVVPSDQGAHPPGCTVGPMKPDDPRLSTWAGGAFAGCPPVVVDIVRGRSLFIPRGWMHHCYTVEAAITISTQLWDA